MFLQHFCSAQQSLLGRQQYQVPLWKQLTIQNKSTYWNTFEKQNIKSYRPTENLSLKKYFLGKKISSSHALTFKYYYVTPSRLNTWFFCLLFSVNWTTRKTKGRSHMLQFPGERAVTCEILTRQHRNTQANWAGLSSRCFKGQSSLSEALELCPVQG